MKSRRLIKINVSWIDYPNKMMSYYKHISKYYNIFQTKRVRSLKTIERYRDPI